MTEEAQRLLDLICDLMDEAETTLDDNDLAEFLDAVEAQASERNV